MNHAGHLLKRQNEKKNKNKIDKFQEALLESRVSQHHVNNAQGLGAARWLNQLSLPLFFFFLI